MKYIVHGSRIKIMVNFKLTLEWVCRNEWATYRPASTCLVVEAGRYVAHSFLQTHSKVSLKLSLFWLSVWFVTRSLCPVATSPSGNGSMRFSNWRKIGCMDRGRRGELCLFGRASFIGGWGVCLWFVITVVSVLPIYVSFPSVRKK